MTQKELQELAENHLALSAAYQQGADAVATTENLTVMRCIRRIQRMVVEPETCAHPKKNLSRANLQRNHLLAQIAMKLADELACNIRAREIQSQELAAKRLARQNRHNGITDDEIPF